MTIFRRSYTEDVADRLNATQSGVSKVWRKYRETGIVNDRPRSGRPRMTTPMQDRLEKSLMTPGTPKRSGSPSIFRWKCNVLDGNNDGTADPSISHLRHFDWTPIPPRGPNNHCTVLQT